MIQVTINTANTETTLHFQPSADFVSCLLTGVMGALPAFLQAFMACLSGGTGSGDYNPGDRIRCGGTSKPAA